MLSGSGKMVPPWNKRGHHNKNSIPKISSITDNSKYNHLNVKNQQKGRRIEWRKPLIKQDEKTKTCRVAAGRWAVSRSVQEVLHEQHDSNTRKVPAMKSEHAGRQCSLPTPSRGKERPTRRHNFGKFKTLETKRKAYKFPNCGQTI